MQIRSIGVAMAASIASGAVAHADSFSLRDAAVEVDLPGDQYQQDGAAITTSDGATMFNASHERDGTCSDYWVYARGDQGGNATISTISGAPSGWSDERASVGDLYVYCRDEGAGYLRLIVLDDSHSGDPTPRVIPVMAAIDQSLGGSSSAPATTTSSSDDDVSADEPAASYSAPASSSDATSAPAATSDPPAVAPAPEATSSDRYEPSPRAPAGVRFVGFVDVLSSDGPGSPNRIGLGLDVPARFLDRDGDDHGVATAASISAAMTDGDFTGDVHVGAGYRLAGDGWSIAATLDLGADRTGGGTLVATDGAPYVAPELQVRLGGATAIEGRAMLVDRSSGDRDEDRLSIGVATSRLGLPLSAALERETWGGQRLTGLLIGIGL